MKTLFECLNDKVQMLTSLRWEIPKSTNQC